MALITCPECGREKISDSAISCPDCGCGIKEHFDKIKNDPKNKVEEYVICPVCGMTVASWSTKSKKCECCNNEDMFHINFSYNQWSQLVVSDLYHDYVQNLSSSNLFDEGLFQQELEARRKRFAYNKQLAEDLRNNPPPTNRVSCPYCSSYNVRKIGMTGRLVSTSIFGLGSKKVGKQWHCNNCRSDF